MPCLHRLFTYEQLLQYSLDLVFEVSDDLPFAFHDRMHEPLVPVAINFGWIGFRIDCVMRSTANYYILDMMD